MECQRCNYTLSAINYIHYRLSSHCDHFNSWCKHCVKEIALSKKQCCVCKATVDESILSSQAFDEKVKSQHSITGNNQTGTIIAEMLDGKNCLISVSASMTLKQLKIAIEAKLNYPASSQLIFFEGKERKQDSQTLFENGIPLNPNTPTPIHLIFAMLNSVDATSMKMQLSLSWGYPNDQQDFLDGSCLLYDNQGNYLECLNFSKTTSGVAGSAVIHSGDVMNNEIKRGTHTIEVDLTTMSSTITKLFFTLSAWNQPYVSYYPNPSVSLHPKLIPNKTLSTYTITGNTTVQTVIMCAVVKTNGCWRVVALGKGSQGSAKDYLPIRSTITSLMQQKLV